MKPSCENNLPVKKYVDLTKKCTIQIRVDEKERDILTRLAEAENFSNLSEYCRWIIRGYARPKINLLTDTTEKAV